MLITKSRLKLFAYTASFTLLLLAQSCKKNDVKPEETVSHEELQQLKTFIASATGSSLTLVEYNSSKKYFLVGKDILISLFDARTRLKNTEISTPGVNGGNQRVYTFTVSRSNVSNISIYADSKIPADWLAALDQAIINWNSTNSYVHMKRVRATTTTTTTGKGKKQTTVTTTTIPPYNILVTTLYDASTTMVAQAFLPYSNGTTGNELDINTYYNSLSIAYKTFTLTHELGHSIGFTHTDQTYGNLISGTPETDPNSVMNSIVLPWSGFTAYDLIAVATIYPK